MIGPKGFEIKFFLFVPAKRSLNVKFPLKFEKIEKLEAKIDFVPLAKMFSFTSGYSQTQSVLIRLSLKHKKSI